MNPDIITSVQNPRVKWLRSLHKNSVRKAEGVVIVEGHKETSLALAAGWELHSLYVCPEIAQYPFATLEPTHLSKMVFARIAYRENSDGILAVFKAPQSDISSLVLSKNPLLLLVEAIEKPGNLGAIVRTADGCGADAVIVCDPRCDIYNPNAIRASVGTLFTKPVFALSNQQVLDYLAAHSITPYAALLSDASKPYDSMDFSTPTALIVGTEHEGLSDFWQQHATPIIIPMLGVNDSLNVSNAAAILAYEALRQRTHREQ